MTLVDSIILHKWAILFYLAILLVIYINRSKFDIHHRILAMYRTKIGLNFMDRIGRKHAELIKFIGYIGIGAGYLGLFFIVGFLIKSMIDIFRVPDAQAAVSVILPGVHVPGSPLYIPLISGWIALFIVILVHESSHGIVARAHGLKIKSSGLFFLGPLMGAFVEPEEKNLVKASDTTQYSVYAAGPFSNILLAVAVILLIVYVAAPINGMMVDNTGVEIAELIEGYPAKDAGLEKGMVITAVNSQTITDLPEFQNELKYVRAGDEVVVTADGKQFTIITAPNPGDERLGYVGVMAGTKQTPVIEAFWFKTLYSAFQWFVELLRMLYIISLGIGLANLLPLGPVDGGRMVKVTLEKIKGPKVGTIWWQKISIATLLLLLFNIMWSLFLQKMVHMITQI